MAISFVKAQFGLPINEIKEKHIVEYFSVERDESLTLEFKSYNTKDRPNFDGVLKSIAAFLNSEGGLLVFGAPQEIRKNGNYKVVKGAPTPIPTSVTMKDSLVRMIADNISYMPIGVLVEPISMSDDSFVYLIEVQESENKPHQLKGRYPVRLDGQSVDAPHYLVEALFKQIKRPELKGFMRVTSYRIFSNPGEPFNRIALKLEVTIFNVSSSVNDTDVYIQLTAETGTLITPSRNDYTYDKGGGRVTIINAASLITDSLPTKRTFDYELTTEQLNNLPSNTVDIQLVFGSKNSITKYSQYRFDPNPQVRLTPGEWGIVFTKTKDLKNILDIEKEENISLSDKWHGADEERPELILNGI